MKKLIAVSTIIMGVVAGASVASAGYTGDSFYSGYAPWAQSAFTSQK